MSQKDGIRVLRTVIAEGGVYGVSFMKNADHIKRHLYNGDAKGSKFSIGISMGDVHDYVIRALTGAMFNVNMSLHVDAMPYNNGAGVKLAMRMQHAIGTAGVVHKNALPEGTSVRLERRGQSPEDQHRVLVADVAPRQTDQLIVDLRRDNENGSRWYVHSTYPGILAPGFDDEQFWSQHVFLIG